MSIAKVYTAFMKSVAGENTDLIIKGEKVHVQTEDWGQNGNVIVSRIFKNGSVIKTFKFPYEKIHQVEIEERRRRALQQLHQYVIEKLHTD